MDGKLHKGFEIIRNEIDRLKKELETTELAIEVKTTSKLSDKHLVGLKLLKEENICRNYLLVSQDTIERNISGIHCLPWTLFLDKLWGDEFFKG